MTDACNICEYQIFPNLFDLTYSFQEKNKKLLVPTSSKRGMKGREIAYFRKVTDLDNFNIVDHHNLCFFLPSLICIIPLLISWLLAMHIITNRHSIFMISRSGLLSCKYQYQNFHQSRILSNRIFSHWWRKSFLYLYSVEPMNYDLKHFSLSPVITQSSKTLVMPLHHRKIDFLEATVSSQHLVSLQSLQ